MTSLECWGLYLSVQRTSSKLESRQNKLTKVNFLQCKGHKTCHKTISIWQVYLFGGCQRFWGTGCKILCDLSIQSTQAHRGSPGLLGSHFAASVCEYDLACCFCPASWLSGQDFPGHPVLTRDSGPFQQHPLQRDWTSDVWAPSQNFHSPVFSSLLSGSVGSLDVLLWKGERGINGHGSTSSDGYINLQPALWMNE